MVAPVPAQSPKLGPHLAVSARDLRTQAHEPSNFCHLRHVAPISLPFLAASTYFPSSRGCTQRSYQDPAASVPLWQISCSQQLAASCTFLCALFRAPFLGFQSVAASFPKTPGVGVPQHFRAEPRFRLHMRHMAPLSPLPSLDCAYFPSPRGVPLRSHPPLLTTHFCFKRGRRYSFPCAGRKTVRRSTPRRHQPPMRPSLLPAAARVRSAPSGIRQ